MDTQSSPRLKKLVLATWLFSLGALFAVGCNRSSDMSSTSDAGSMETDNLAPTLPDVPDSECRFESAFMLQADGKPVAVESPGYACPTIADVDGDDVDDLVVGQFSGGKMKWYRNTAKQTEAPEYSIGKWIQSNDQPAQVPGVY